MNETAKASARRKTDPFFIDTVFRGNAIDIGAGPDILNKNSEFPYLESVLAFDKHDGNAETIDEYFDPETFQVVHASQCLEHMENPKDALMRWIRICKTGGYIVITIPDFDLYEKRQFPSRFNPDHRAFFTLEPDKTIYDIPGIDYSRYIVVSDWIINLADIEHVKIKRMEIVDTNYNYSLPTHIDQTLGDAEAFIEFVLRKL